MSTIGQRIRESRKKAGLTQAALAGECGISRAAVAQWEGDVTKPSLGHLQKAADALDAWLPWLTIGEWGQFAFATARPGPSAAGTAPGAGGRLSLCREVGPHY